MADQAASKLMQGMGDNTEPESEFMDKLCLNYITPSQISMARNLLSAEQFARFQIARKDSGSSGPESKTKGLGFGHSLARNYTKSRPKFDNFMKLPLEIRNMIYEYTLCTGRVIRPQLCDETNGRIKFHDNSQHSRLKPNHNAINKLLGIARVSKTIRTEALPCFYSANTFDVGADTAAYFMHLKYLRRFNMIRHVRFQIYYRKPQTAAMTLQQTLQQLHQHDSSVESYERTFAYRTRHSRHSRHTLVNHPNHIKGGIPDMNLFICLRMLTSSFSDPSPNFCTTKLILAVPDADFFTTFDTLKWFPTACHSLGIRLYFCECRRLDHANDSNIGIVWHQRDQKKDFGEASARPVNVRSRALEIFPGLDETVCCKKEGYFRVSCDKERCTWFDVKYD